MAAESCGWIKQLLSAEDGCGWIKMTVDGPRHLRTAQMTVNSCGWLQTAENNFSGRQMLADGGRWLGMVAECGG